MAGTLNDLFNVQITTTISGLTRVGFGTPLIAAYHTLYADRVREYTSLAGMVDDGFAVTDLEYIAASKIFSQTPRPVSLKIGRLANRPTQVIKLTPNVYNSTAYTLTVNGTDFTYTSDASATAKEIVEGLAALITGVDVTPTEDDSVLTLTSANVVRTGFTLDLDYSQWSAYENTTANPGGGGIDTDMTNIEAFDNDFYTYHLAVAGDAIITAAAAHVAALTTRKMLFANVSDSDVLASGSSDIASQMKALNYPRLALMFSKSPSEYKAEAWAGIGLPEDPGSINWAYQTLTGVSADAFTSTEAARLESKLCNYYANISGISNTFFGYVSKADNYIDLTHGIDALTVRIQEELYSLFSSVKKIPYTDAGIQQAKAAVKTVLDRFVKTTFLIDNANLLVTAPLASEVSAEDRADRVLPDLEFSADAQGAINKVNPVNGVISI